MAEEIGRMQVVLGAETAQHDASLIKSAEVAKTTGTAVATSAKKTAEAEALAAKFAGDAVQEQTLRKLRLKASEVEASADYRQAQNLLKRGYLDEAEGANVVAAALQRKIAATLAATAADETAAVAHAQISERMAASAAVRGLENGNVGIRSVENLLVSTLGLGGALKTIFPLLGTVGLAGMFFEMGEKGYEAFVKVQKATTLTREAFAELHDRAGVRIDDLQLETSKIQDQIDKLSGHPNNGLATALLEAKKMADQLLTSLQADRKELQELLKEHNTGVLGSILSSIGAGPTTTGTQGKEFVKDQKQLTEAIRKANAERDHAVAGVTDQKALTEATRIRNEAVRKAFQSQIDVYTTEAARLRKQDAAVQVTVTRNGVIRSHSDSSQQIANAEGRAQQLTDLKNLEIEDEKNFAAREKLGAVKQGKGDDAAQRKAAEAQMKAMETALAERRMNHDVSTVEEYKFWQGMLAAAAKYPDNLLKVKEHVGRLYQEIGKEIEAGLKKIDEAHKKAAEQAKRDFETMERIDVEWARAIQNLAKADAELVAVQQHEANAMGELILAHDLATGAVTRHDAAIQMAAYHAAGYAIEIAKLKEEQKAIMDNDELSDPEKQARTRGLDVQISRVEGDAARTAAQDKWAEFSTTAVGGATAALQEFIAATKDSSRQAHDLVSSTLNTVNGAIVAEITGQHRRGQWSNVGRGVATEVAGSVVKKGEGALMDALHLGQLGTRANPFWTRNADAGTIPSYAAGKGGFLGGLASTLTGMFPGFAGGGDVAAGTTAWVGEKGPELVRFGQSAHVTPNGQTANVGGVTHTYSIDARGSHDPAATEAAVQRGIAAAAPHIAAGTIAALDSRNSRMPASQRR